MNISSLITAYDPLQPGQYKVTYGIGKNHKSTTSLVLTATNRYDAIKKVKAISPLFCCVDVERMGGEWQVGLKHGK